MAETWSDIGLNNIKKKRQLTVCQCKTLMLMHFIWAAEHAPA